MRIGVLDCSIGGQYSKKNFAGRSGGGARTPGRAKLFAGYVKFLGYCCGSTVRSEQQHNQDLREIYKVVGILEFITFYHNALHLTTPFTRMHCI